VTTTEAASAEVAATKPAATMPAAAAARERVGRDGGAPQRNRCGQDDDLAWNDPAHFYCLSVDTIG
jgi:hypothetical protein